jgi:hypothetical protein
MILLSVLCHAPTNFAILLLAILDLGHLPSLLIA